MCVCGTWQLGLGKLNHERARTARVNPGWGLAAAPPVVGSGAVSPCGGRLLPPPAVGSGPVCRCPPAVLWLRRLLMMMTASGSAPFRHH